MQLTARMIRAYKGAAASILLLYIANGGKPMTQMEMARGSGYRDEAINEAVWMLREDGLITETGRYTWGLLSQAQQLPLGAVDAGEALVEENRTDVIDLDPLQGTAAVAPDNPELALNERMNESDSIHRDDSFIHSCEASSGKTGAADKVTAENLSTFGFYGRGVADLLKIRGLTLREVRFHVAKAPNLGAALHRIKKRQAVPDSWEAAEQIGDDRRRYVEGQFSEFIEH